MPGMSDDPDDSFFDQLGEQAESVQDVGSAAPAPGVDSAKHNFAAHKVESHANWEAQQHAYNQHEHEHRHSFVRSDLEPVPEYPQASQDQNAPASQDQQQVVYNQYQQNGGEPSLQGSYEDPYPGWTYNYDTATWEPKQDASSQLSGYHEQVSSYYQSQYQRQQPDYQQQQQPDYQQQLQQHYQLPPDYQQPQQHQHYQPSQDFQQQYQQYQLPQEYQQQQHYQYQPPQEQQYQQQQYQLQQYEQVGGCMPTSQAPTTQQEALRSTAGRPPHTVMALGFGGRLVVLKQDGYSSDSKCQVYNLNQLVEEKCFGFGRFNGPLVGNSSMKDVLKWIDEKMVNCSEEPGCSDPASLRRLWGLLKICCQHYGNIRSTVGGGVSVGKQEGGPEAALAKLLAPVDGDSWAPSTRFSSIQPSPSDEYVQATATELKRLLISGKQKEALDCAREGQLWGPALLLARQLGEQSYCETVAEMARRQFMPGSPLRTLSLLYSGQQAGVFAGSDLSSGTSASQEVVDGMLQEWQENLAIMAANRTNGDEPVIMHLGDCLLAYRRELAGAHICYLVANASFDPHPTGSRMCLIGADHRNCPRTYARAEAIQRTEVYEYAKVSGNSQFVLLPFQPYKLVYASMLAEAGRINEALKYCQAVSKALKTAGQGTDICKEAAQALEERLRVHSQAGSSSIVSRLFNNIGFHRIMGSTSAPPRDNADMSRPSTASGTRNFVVPSASMEPINNNNSTRSSMPARSVSEPDLNRQTQGTSTTPGRLTSLVQKAIGFIRPVREARLGDPSSFRYDHELKRWVDDSSSEQAAAELTPAPPPRIPLPRAQSSSPAGGMSVAPPPAAVTPAVQAMSPAVPHTPERSQPAVLTPSTSDRVGIPPIPPGGSQYAARTRNVRSRYVDTINKNVHTGASSRTPSSTFLPPARQSPMPPAQFFVPAAPEPSIPETPPREEAGLSVPADSTPVASTQSLLVPPTTPPQSLPMVTQEGTFANGGAAAVSSFKLPEQKAHLPNGTTMHASWEAPQQQQQQQQQHVYAEDGEQAAADSAAAAAGSAVPPPPLPLGARLPPPPPPRAAAAAAGVAPAAPPLVAFGDDMQEVEL